MCCTCACLGLRSSVGDHCTPRDHTQWWRLTYGPQCRTADFYADAGVPCPPNRALADHFIHSMNTDFQKEAATFADSAAAAVPPEGAAKADSAIVPVATGKTLAATAGSGAHGGACSMARLPPAVANAQEGIKALRSRFEACRRVRALPPSVPPIALHTGRHPLEPSVQDVPAGR